MSVGGVPWYRRPWNIAGVLIAVVIIFAMVWFAVTVVRYRTLLQSGELDLESEFRTAQLQSSVSSRFANAAVSREDLARIVPRQAVPTLGSSTATVKIIEFVDYECPFCKRAEAPLRAFMQKHTYDAQLQIRDFPIVELHPNAEHAAIAANCVFRILPERYWEFHDRLFASQSALSPDNLRTYAQQIRVDLSKYDICVKGKAPLSSIKRSVEDGIAAGVQGTPTFFVNGVKIQGVLDEAALEVIFEEARRTATQL